MVVPKDSAHRMVGNVNAPGTFWQNRSISFLQQYFHTPEELSTN